LEIPGVNTNPFLKTSLNAIKKASGEKELDALEFLKLIKEKSKELKFDEKNDFSNLLDRVNSLDSFTESLNRQILSELSRKLFEEQFGDGNIKPGNYLFGSLYLQITNTNQGLLINILDTSNGDQSEIVIPK
uniref:curli assembly protein CsgF n=1 Tax=Chryseobacterium cucumeris TaxID=1813611 RepID=UPI0030B86787